MKYLVIDIETTGLVWSSQILSVAVAYRENDQIVTKAWNVTAYDLFHTATPIPQVRSELEKLFLQAEYVVGHNLSFDLSFLFKYNLVDPEWLTDKVVDTMVLARMTQPFESVSLFNVASDIGISDPIWKKMKEKRGVLSNVAVETLLNYNETDVKYNLLVVESLVDKALKVYNIKKITEEGNFSIVVAKMRCNGLPISFTKLDKLITDYANIRRVFINDVLMPMRIQGGNDATEIIKFLQLHSIPISNYTEKGKVKTDEDSLVNIMNWVVSTYSCTPTQKPDAYNDYRFDDVTFSKLDTKGKEIVRVLGAVLATRHYEKALSTWLKPLHQHGGEDGCVHALFTAAGAVSYRLTCSEPNLQAYPFLDIWEPYANADYSQAEYRLMAMYARSTSLAKAYERGDDAHTGTAKILFGVETVTKDQRKLAKVFNFASLYGAGIDSLVKSSGMSESKVRELQTKFRNTLPEIGRLTKEANRRWKENGYIQLWDGVRIWATDFDREHRAYKGANQLCQGGVAKLTAKAMVKLDAMGIPILGQIHDSIQFPVTVDPEIIKSVMQTTLDERVSNLTKPPIPMVADYEIKCGVAKDLG